MINPATFSLSGDIILYDSHLAVYKHSLDLILYFIASPSENELMLSTALNSLVDALSMLLRNQLEKRAVLESLDLVLLCLDETVDDGCVFLTPALPYAKISNTRWQNHSRHRLNCDCLSCEQATTRHDGNCHQ